MNRDTIQKILIGFIILICIFIAYKVYTLIGGDKTGLNANVSSLRMTYGRLLEYIEMGWVTKVDLYNNCRTAIVQASSPELGNRPQSIRVELPVATFQIIQKLKEYDINFDAHPIPEKSIFLTIASNLILPLVFVAGLIFFFQNSENFPPTAGGSPLNLGKSPARVGQNPETGVSFKDIAGIDEAKSEFEEIVSFLKEPERYTIVGAKIPKGVLLIGPPGTGKTLLAKAIAKEASVPFYSIAGSEFVEMFIGIGAARIRDLFKKASETTPCIVFIDEIDAVGRQRGAGIGGGNDEREQTLNQLLTEMDGFRENKGVIVVGATNRSDILDSALLRPGRFDRQITVNLPDRNGRLGILQVHSKNKVLAQNISLLRLANRTIGFSGADLANVLNEAGILATRNQTLQISDKEVSEAIDRIVGGIEGTELDDTKNKRLVAYHEVGHGVVGTVLKWNDEVEKVTLTPRGNAKGLTWFIPVEDQTLLTYGQLRARITTILGGRAAEKVIFGEGELTTGASDDLQRVTKIARQMVKRYGMSSLGPMSFEPNPNRRRLFAPPTRQPMSNRVDAAVASIVKDCQVDAIKIVRENRVAIDFLVDELVAKETLSGKEFRKLFNKYSTLPIKYQKPRIEPFSKKHKMQTINGITEKLKDAKPMIEVNSAEK